MEELKTIDMKEIWKDIPGYEPYKVSNLGRIKGPNKILKENHKSTGYVYANLTINGKNKSKCIHRLVMLSFIGESKLDVDHINGVKSDNRLTAQ